MIASLQLLSTSTLSVVTSFRALFIRAKGEQYLLYPSFSGWDIWRSPFCCFLCLLPDSVSAVLRPSSPQLYTTRLHLCTLPRSPVLTSHCLCIYFLPFSLTSLSLLSHAGLLPEFLLLGITNSCVP